MSFRGRLTLFFVIIAVVPTVAAAVALFAIIPASETGKSDARLAGGLRATLVLYRDARTRAEPRLARVTRDPALRRALLAGRYDRIRRRLEEFVAAREAEAVVLYDPQGAPQVRAGNPAAVAFATVAPATPEGFRMGTLALSVTSAPRFVAAAKHLTGLETRLFRGGERLASTLPEGESAAAGDGEAAIAGRRWRGRFQEVPEAVGPPVRLGAFEDSQRLAAAIERAGLLVAGILAGLVAFALVGAAFLIRGQHRLIVRFLDAARGLGKGDFSRSVAVEGSDEFAALGAEFNHMSAELAARTHEVESKQRDLEETIRSVGKAFAAGLDRQGIVDLTIRTAVKACAAEAGRSLPLNSDKVQTTFVGLAGDAVREALGDAERKAVQRAEEVPVAGAPPTGSGAASGVGVPDGPIASDGSGSSSHGSGSVGSDSPDRGRVAVCRSAVRGAHALAAPLNARASAGSEVACVGVLSIARGGEGFTQTECELFSDLAEQAALSLQKAYLHERAQHEAVTDELTGLFNLRHFHRVLTGEAERNRRFGDSVGLLMLDIDDFKPVNDTYGHQQGDLVLIEVARLVKDMCREIDAPARYGGEEIAIVLPQTDVAGAERLAERLRLSIAALQIRRLDGHGRLRVTASFGVASIPHSGEDERGAIAAADAALYRAKREGKNRVARA
ncbi:MAG: diguanylate cyclase [Actinomycetota bacterium]|nr:diguanylate cyclase [Actinomycetota bacterium]